MEKQIEKLRAFLDSAKSVYHGVALLEKELEQVKGQLDSKK